MFEIICWHIAIKREIETSDVHKIATMLNMTCLGAGTTGTSSFREDCDCDLTALMADAFLRKHFREQQSHYQYKRTILFAKLIFMAGSPMMTSLKILLPLFSFS